MNFQDEEQVFQSGTSPEVLDNAPWSRSDSSNPYESFHDSGSFSADYTALTSTTQLEELETPPAVNTKELRKLVQMQTQRLDPETADLLSLMCVALEKANEERNNFEQMLRQRHMENIHQMSDLNQEVEEQLGLEKERLDRDYKERQEQMQQLVQSELKELQSRLDLLESENSQLRDNLHHVDRAKSDLLEEYEELKKDNRCLEESLSHTKDELTLTRNTADSIKAEQINELKKREKSIEEVAKEAEEDRINLMKKIEELERERKRLKAERDQLDEFKNYWEEQSRHRPPSEEDNTSTPQMKTLLEPRAQSADEEFWMLDPRNKTTDVDETSGSSEVVLRSSGGQSLSSSMSDVSMDDIHRTVNEHIREADDTTSTFYSERIYKIVFLGDTSVGKTSFIQRFHHNVFKDRLQSTVGIDFLLKTVTVHKQPCTLQLWDTCGQEKFRALTRNYFRKADGVILMYDVTRPETFYSLKTWMEDVAGFAPGDVCLMIVGNKADLRPVELDAELVKTTLGSNSDFSFTEVSSRNGQNVDQCMTQFTSRLLLRDQDRLAFQESNNSHFALLQSKKKKCCAKSS